MRAYRPGGVEAVKGVHVEVCGLEVITLVNTTSPLKYVFGKYSSGNPGPELASLEYNGVFSVNSTYCNITYELEEYHFENDTYITYTKQDAFINTSS